jgi:hypothetical protein
MVDYATARCRHFTKKPCRLHPAIEGLEIGCNGPDNRNAHIGPGEVNPECLGAEATQVAHNIASTASGSRSRQWSTHFE